LAELSVKQGFIFHNWSRIKQILRKAAGGYNFAMKYVAGHYYHIYNRGVGKQNIFSHEENYLFLLRRIGKYLPFYPISLIAYCLMPNHYHMLIFAKQDGAPGQFIQRVFNSYTQALNLQQGRSGTLFEGRAKSKLIFENEYLFQITRYIHLNPVRAGLVAKPEDWIFSNYREFIGTRKGQLFDMEFLEAQFGSSDEYRSFVETEIPLEIERRVGKYYFD
jgi:putative transposase